jgi:hypothetical protein
VPEFPEPTARTLEASRLHAHLENRVPRLGDLGTDGKQNDYSHYAAHQTRDMKALAPIMAHITKYFTGTRLVDIQPDACTRYTLQRVRAGAANGTIRNELDLLTRVLTNAVDNHKLEKVPKIPKPKAPAGRAGFVNDAQFEAIRARLSCASCMAGLTRGPGSG